MHRYKFRIPIRLSMIVTALALGVIQADADQSHMNMKGETP